MGAETPVYVETGTKKVFAAAVEWPGWCRSGRDEERALAALADYAERYAPVAAAAGVPFPGRAPRFAVVDRIAGSGTTDFGAPGSVPPLDLAPLSGDEGDRLAALVAASWEQLAAVVAAAPAEAPEGATRGRP